MMVKQGKFREIFAKRWSVSDIICSFVFYYLVICVIAWFVTLVWAIFTGDAKIFFACMGAAIMLASIIVCGAKIDP